MVGLIDPRTLVLRGADLIGKVNLGNPGTALGHLPQNFVEFGQNSTF